MSDKHVPVFTYEIKCPRCKGRGVNPQSQELTDRLCTLCDGRGYIIEKGGQEC